MARNVDPVALKKLGYTADPIPGDPLSIADAVQYLSALAKKTGSASTTLAGLVKEGPDAPLTGQVATELRNHVKDQLKLFVDKLSEATTIATNALTTFSTDLAAAQKKAQPAIEAAAALPDNDPALATHKATVDAARTDYVTAFDTARDALLRAAGMRTSPKTLSEEIWDFFKIFTIVLTVLGVLFGGPLGLLAFGANLVVLGKTLADFAQGKANGLELFLNILGVLFPSTKALLPLLTAGLKNLLVGLGKGAVNLFKGGANFLSLLGTGLKGFNVAGWKFAAIYAGIVAGGLIFKGGLFVAKLVAFPFRAIAWTARAGWAVGKQAFKELKGWGSLGILLPVAGNEIKALGLARALRIGFWERGVLGSQKDFVRAALGLPSAGAGSVGKIGGSALDKPPILGGGAGPTPIPTGPLTGLVGPNAGLGFDGVGKVNALGGFTLDNLPRVGSSIDTAVFVPASSGLYTAHHGLGAYSFGGGLLGHEGLTNVGITIGHTAATPQLQFGSLQGVLEQALGKVTMNALDAGGVSTHALTGAVGDASTFGRTAVNLGEDVRMTPLPEVRRLTHGDTTLTSVSSERFIAAPAGPVTGQAPLPTNVHVPAQSIEGVAAKPLDVRPTQLPTSTAPTNLKVTATDAFDLLAPGGGALKATPTSAATPAPVQVSDPATSAGASAGASAYKDNALKLLAGGSRELDHLPAVSARFTPMDLAGGQGVPVRADLAGSRGVVESATSFVGERIPLRAQPPTAPPVTPAVPHAPAPTPPSTAVGGPGVHGPAPGRTLAGFGWEQTAVVTKVLDDLATGPGPGGKSTQVPESRIAAWHDWARARHDFDQAASVERGLKDRLTSGTGGSGGAGAVHVELMAATAARANAGLALADAAAGLKAWGVDAAAAAPKVAEALAKLPGLRGGMRPSGTATYGAPVAQDNGVWRSSRSDGIGYVEAHPLGDTGNYRLVRHPAPADATSEVLAGYDPRTSPLAGHATRIEPGVFRVDFHAPGTVDRFEVWSGSTLTHSGESLPGGLYKVFGEPRTPNGHFQVWDDLDLAGHRVVHDVRALGDGRFQVFEGPRAAAGRFQIWDTADLGTRTVLRDGHVLERGGYQVFDGLRGSGGRFEIRTDADLVGPGVTHVGTPVAGTGHYRVVDTLDQHFQVWSSSAADAHTVLADGRHLGDGRFQVFDGHRLNGGPFELRDARGTVTHTGSPVAGTGHFRVGEMSGDDFRIWSTADAHAPDAVRVLQDWHALGGGRFQVFDGLRANGGEFRVLAGSDVTSIVLKDGRALGDGRYLVVESPAAAGPTNVELWSNGNLATREITHTGRIEAGQQQFRVTSTADRSFQIWETGDTGTRLLKDAHPTGSGGYQVFDGLKADRAGFEVWADDVSRVGNDNTLTGKTVTHRAEVDGTDVKVTDLRRDTWEKWDSSDLVDHKLVEYPIDGPVAGASRRIDHTTGRWNDVHPGPGPAHGVAWADMPFRKGTVETWPTRADGSGGGIRKLVDDNGAVVYTRDPSGIPGSTNWIEAMRDRAGKWTWVEKTADGQPVAAGNRYVRWNDSSYDIANNVFGRNSRHFFGGTVRQNIPQTGGGMFVAEKVGFQNWSWQRWADNGDLLASGKLDFRLDQSLGFKARVTHVRLDGDAAPREVTGVHIPVALERFAPVRFNPSKIFSTADKARGIRQYTFDANAASFDRQFKGYVEHNYVKEEVANLGKFGDELFKTRRIWQQRFDVPSHYGKADFPGGLLAGEDRLMRYWRVERLDANGVGTGEFALRIQRMSDATWQDFANEGLLLRESRALSDGRKLEYVADAVPGRTLDGWTIRGQWKETQAGATAVGYREFDESGQWRDVRTGDEGAGVVRATVDAKGTVREYGTPRPLDRPMPANPHDELGTWLDRNRLGQITARRDEIDGGFLKATMDNKPDGRFTWTREDANGAPLAGPEPSTGYRTTNRGGAQMWSEGFDDAFKDFAEIGGRDVLVHERKLLGDGRISVVERVEVTSGTFEYRSRVKTADGNGYEASPGGHPVTRLDPDTPHWRDVIKVRNADGEEVTVTIRAGRGDAIREYKSELPGGIASERHWSDVRNGTEIRSLTPVRNADGTVVAYLEKDIAYLQSRIYDPAGNLVVHQSFTTKIFEKVSDADPSLVNKVRAAVSPDKIGTNGSVDGKFRLVGRGEDDGGFLNEFRGYNRAMGDTNRRHWGAAGLDGSIEWSFGRKAWTKAGMEFMQDFGLAMIAGLITEQINDGDVSGRDVGKVALNALVSASMAGLMTRFHEAKLAPGTFSPKQFKDGLTANDWGKAFNTNPYFGDNWKTDWSNFDTALRWRSGLYKFSLGLVVNPFTAFVNGSINAAVFGDKYGTKHTGVDALKFGAVAALGSLASAAVGPGALRFALDAYAAGRFWRKAGILDISLKLGQKLADAQLNRIFQERLDLARKYDHFLNGPKP